MLLWVGTHQRKAMHNGALTLRVEPDMSRAIFVTS